MTHRRKEIRDRVVAILRAADPAIVDSAQVYSNRRLSLEDDLLPALNVRSADEPATPFEVANSASIRTLQLVIEITTKAADNESIDDALDAIADQVEDAMDADPNLNGLAISCTVSSTGYSDDVEGDATIGRLRLTYAIQYRY